MGVLDMQVISLESEPAHMHDLHTTVGKVMVPRVIYQAYNIHKRPKKR